MIPDGDIQGSRRTGQRLKSFSLDWPTVLVDGTTEGESMSTSDFDRDQQLEIMKQRLTAAGMSRRDVLKVAAVAAAGTALAGGVGVALRPEGASAQTTGE